MSPAFPVMRILQRHVWWSPGHASLKDRQPSAWLASLGAVPASQPASQDGEQQAQLAVTPLMRSLLFMDAASHRMPPGSITDKGLLLDVSGAAASQAELPAHTSPGAAPGAALS